VLALLAVSALLIRSVLQQRTPAEQPLLVEVGGDVPRPGIQALPPGATVADALSAAGADPGQLEDPFVVLPLRHGQRVELTTAGELRLWLAQQPLLVGLPVDPNLAGIELLEQLPGLGPSLAGAIVAERRVGGPYTSVDDLQRARGIGPAKLEQLRPFLEVTGLREPGIESVEEPP